LILDAWHRDEVRCRLAKRVAMVGKRRAGDGQGTASLCMGVARRG
jgi:hypothetical protein